MSATPAVAPPTQAQTGRRRPRVWMFVRNECTHDARVLKEARTLAHAGYEVEIVATHLYGKEPDEEERDGFRITRVIVDPLHYRILRRHKDLYDWVFLRSPSIAPIAGGMVLAGAPLLAFHSLAAGLAGTALGGAFGWLASVALRSSKDETAQTEEPTGEPLQTSIRGYVALTFNALVRPLILGWYLALRKVLFVFHKPLTLRDYVRRSWHVVRERPGDLYHAHDLNTLVAAWRSARKTGGRIVYDSHELNLEAGSSALIVGAEKWFLRKYERFLIRRADATITVNESIAETLARWYCVPKPSVVMNCSPVYEGPRSDHVLRQKAAVDADAPLVLYQGGFGPNRGLPELLRAMTYLEDAVLVLLGGGPLLHELEAMGHDLGIGERLRFVATVPHDDLVRHTTTADVGVVPFQRTSLNNYLATPNKIFEYLMAGVPIAVSAFPEMTRVVQEHRVGAVFEPDDPEDIAHALREILDDPEREAMRDRAWALARTRFSWEHESRMLLEIYRSLSRVVATAS